MRATSIYLYNWVDPKFQKQLVKKGYIFFRVEEMIVRISKVSKLGFQPIIQVDSEQPIAPTETTPRLLE